MASSDIGTGDPLSLFRHRQTGTDAIGAWTAEAEIVHRRAHVAVYRELRWRRTVRMEMEAFEAFCRAGLDIVANARLASKGGVR